MKRTSSRGVPPLSTHSSKSNVAGDETPPQHSLQTHSPVQEQLPGAAALDVPPATAQAPSQPVPVLDQVNNLLEALTTVPMQGPPRMTAPGSVNQILSGVQTLPDLAAAFKLLDAASILDVAGELSGALAALCLRHACEHPDDMCALIQRLLMHSHTDQQQQEALKALLANADNLPLPALRALVVLVQEMKDLPSDLTEAFEALLGRYHQRELEASVREPQPVRTDASAALLDHPPSADDTMAMTLTGSDLQPGLDAQVFPPPEQFHRPLEEGQTVSWSLLEMLKKDPGPLIIKFAKPVVDLLPPQRNDTLLLAQESFINFALVNSHIYERVELLWRPELAALRWCFRLNRFDRKLAETPGNLDSELPGSDLQQALVELVLPHPHAVALECLPNATQSRIDLLIKRLFTAKNVSVISGLVDVLFSELAKQAGLGDTPGFNERAFVDLKQFARRAVVAAVRFPHPTHASALFEHVWNRLNLKLPPKQFAECLIELGVILHMSPPLVAELTYQMGELAERYPEVVPSKALLNLLLEFLQAPTMASEEVVTAVLEHLDTAVVWGPSEQDLLLSLAERAVLAPGAAASLSQLLRDAVETAVTRFIVYACSLYKDGVHPGGSFSVGANVWMDEVLRIREYPIELLQRVFPRLDLGFRLMILMQRRINPSDPRLFGLVRDFVRDNGIVRHVRLRVVRHWLEPLYENAALRPELQDMFNALRQPGVRHGKWLIP